MRCSCVRVRPALLCSVTSKPSSHAHAGIVGLRPLREVRVAKGRVLRATSESDGSGAWGEGFAKLAKQVQGSLPVIGLISRLASPEGGFGELSYPEFTRACYEAGNEEFNIACIDLERAHGKGARHQNVLMVLWMVSTGAAVVPKKDILLASRRLSFTSDIELEMDRFEMARRDGSAQYRMSGPPDLPVPQKVELAVDTLCELALQLKPGAAVKAADVAMLTTIIQHGLRLPNPSDSISLELVKQAFNDRPQRANNYT